MSEPRIFDREGVTVVAFGWGAIQCGVATDADGQVSVHLADMLRENPISSVKSAGPWEPPAGRTVILGFNNEASIDVLEVTLKEARKALWKAQASQ